MKKAVIFDLDGTLIDSELFYLNLLLEFLKRKGMVLPFEEACKTVGAHNSPIWENVARAHGGSISGKALRQEYKDEFERKFRNRELDYSQMQFADVLPVLEKLRADGVRMAIASSSSDKIIRRVVEQQNWERFFSVLVSGDNFRKSKPDPEIYRYTMKQLGTAPEETLVVEDSTYGIEAGKAAGVMVVARRDLRFGFHQEKADCLFDDMREILPKISDKYV
ncbi:HAD family hydrolase [Laedolimicola sp.]|uniref:HAD family hydrolase n=1 Tax=Laedolimicola sp. TaxID=2981663 RepID=UPI003F809D49